MRHAVLAASLAFSTRMRLGRAPARSAAKRLFAWLDDRRERMDSRAIPQGLDARI